MSACNRHSVWAAECPEIRKYLGVSCVEREGRKRVSERGNEDMASLHLSTNTYTT